MTWKIMGALLVIAASGGFGFSLAAAYQHSENSLRQLLRGIEFMICELEFRQTPLPELCRMAGSEAGGQVGKVFFTLAEELENQLVADAGTCMAAVVQGFGNLPVRTERNLLQLGHTLGRFALSGQVSGFRSAAALCRRDLESMAMDKDVRLRSYRTLGICCGVALAILFL